MSSKYKESCAWYRKWVVQNPEVVSQVEKTFRVLSYCLSGFTDDNQILSELVYALSNLLVFFNDNILRRATLTPKISLSQHRLQQWLTVLDNVEVFFELASNRVWGETGKWLVVAAIQLLRAIFRYILLCRLKSGMQSSPPIPPLDRKDIIPVTIAPSVDDMSDPDADSTVYGETGSVPDLVREHHLPPLTFEGRRSGRVIRSLHATPEMGLRTWKLPKEEQPIREEELGMTELAGFSLVGETLYISRPIIHLCCLFVWGWTSWKPWLLSIATDIASLEMMKQEKKVRFNSKEKAELVNRRLMLLFYLLRSPCYNSLTKKRLESFLRSVGSTVPFTRLITNPLIDYLPVWQGIYSYNWGH